MNPYATLHPWLVAHTRAYQDLYARLGQLCAARGPVAEAALVPASTGEVLTAVGQAARSWTAVDIDPDCLASCAAIWPGIRTVEADLGAEVPLAPDSVDLVLTIHALHFVPDPQGLAAGIARALRPGGRWLIVHYERGSTWTRARRIRRAHGAAQLLGMAPWLTLDSLMRVVGGAPDFVGEDALRELLAKVGLEVEHAEPSFRGVSVLIEATRQPA